MRLCGIVVLPVLLLLVSAASASAVTFGADVSQVPNAPYGCEARPSPFGNGSWYAAPSGESSCSWTVVNNQLHPSEGLITPAGTGTITAVRIHVGSVTGPMQLVVFNFEVDPNNPANAQCCNAAYVGPTFTPAPNSITTLNTNLPVHTDGPGQMSAGPYKVGDLLGLNILENNVPIPAIDETGGGAVPVNEQPSDGIHWNAYVQGQTDKPGGYSGWQLDMNADWVPSVSNVNPSVSSVSVVGGKPTVKKGKFRLKLACGTGAACGGQVLVQNLGTQGTKASIAKKKKVIYARGKFNIAAGKSKKIAIPLTGKGKAAAKHHKKLTVYIVITMGGKKFVHKVKLRF